ncbi:MAG: L,D-transpeptidase family protein [Sneathiellales bacterium]|nr:L,D-transpeptidase family protein [Sneathiellales bacterium]
MMIEVNGNGNHTGKVVFENTIWNCALGKSGITEDKNEGDHASPAGTYPLRALYYRKDRIQKPVCYLDAIEISQEMGWCDDPVHPEYNRRISLPFSASHETLWRHDALYDLIVVLGHNDNPPVPGKGSCIFMHVAKEGYEGTEGCVALQKQDLLELLALLKPDTYLRINPRTLSFP